MSSGLEDWIAWASGRIYSVATVEAAQALSIVGRSRVRRAVGAGRLPAGELEQRYAAAYCADRTRIGPGEHDPRGALGLAAAFALVGILAATRGLWLTVLSVCFGGVGLYLGAVAEPRRQRHRLAVAHDARRVLSPLLQTTLDAGLRHPVRFSRRQKVAGAAALGAGISGGTVAVVLLINLVFPSGDGLSLLTAAGLAGLLALVWLFVKYVSAGKYWRLFDGEPQTPGTPALPTTTH